MTWLASSTCRPGWWSVHVPAGWSSRRRSAGVVCTAIAWIARVLGVSRQGYYAWTKRGPCVRAQQDQTLTEKIREHHEGSDGIYGAPRIHTDLRELDRIRIGRNRVARLMRAAGLTGVTRRKGVRTTVTDRQAGRPGRPGRASSTRP